jgi:ferritin-like metal-binding protein YciE
MKTLKDLMIHEIQDLISAESQLIDAMPQIKESVTDHELKSMLDELLVNTEKHKNRLAEALNLLHLFGHGVKS